MGERAVWMGVVCLVRSRTGSLARVSSCKKSLWSKDADRCLLILDFSDRAKVAGWLSVASLVFNVLLLLTYAVLPADKSSRHYSSIGVCVATVSLNVSSLALGCPMLERNNTYKACNC